MLLACGAMRVRSEYSTQLNTARLKLLQARDDLLGQSLASAQAKLQQVSSNSTQYATLLSALIVQGIQKVQAAQVRTRACVYCPWKIHSAVPQQAESIVVVRARECAGFCPLAACPSALVAASALRRVCDSVSQALGYLSRDSWASKGAPCAPPPWALMLTRLDGEAQITMWSGVLCDPHTRIYTRPFSLCRTPLCGRRCTDIRRGFGHLPSR